MEQEEQQLWFMVSERDLRVLLTHAADHTMEVEELISELMIAATYHDLTGRQ